MQGAPSWTWLNRPPAFRSLNLCCASRFARVVRELWAANPRENVQGTIAMLVWRHSLRLWTKLGARHQSHPLRELATPLHVVNVVLMAGKWELGFPDLDLSVTICPFSQDALDQVRGQKSAISWLRLHWIFFFIFLHAVNCFLPSLQFSV